MDIDTSNAMRPMVKKVNWGGLLALVSTLTINTALVGFVIAGNN